MHLAFLTPEYPHPLSTLSGGIGTSIKNLAFHLRRRNIKITVFVYGQNSNVVFEDDGINFHFIEQKCYNFLGWWRYRKFLERYINTVIIKDKIEAIEAPDWTGITAFIKLKCPLVIRFHGSDSYFCDLEARPQKKKNFWFEKIALHSADHLLSVSEFTAVKTREIFNLKKEIKVIPNSVDVEIFKPGPGDIVPNTILYFGSIIRKKGVLELAQIFNLVVKKNPEAKLLLAGRDVPDIQTRRSTKELFLEKLSGDAKEKVSWLGSLPYEDIKKHISRAAVVVLPSFAEALPMTWLEAMAMEKALVTSNIGWAKEVMENGKTGYTVNPKDHLTYAEKVLTLLDNRELAKQMGKTARKRIVKHFSTEVVVKENIRFYEGIVRL